jgi:uncharacterized protein YigA (DUF484 family)
MAADLSIGMRVPSASDLAYRRYQEWCSRLGCPAASLEVWQRSNGNISSHSSQAFETPASFTDLKRRRDLHRAALR